MLVGLVGSARLEVPMVGAPTVFKPVDPQTLAMKRPQMSPDAQVPQPQLRRTSLTFEVIVPEPLATVHDWPAGAAAA